MIALSFDTETDKINPTGSKEGKRDISQTVPEILDLLKKHKIKATFFVTGTATKKFSDVIKKIEKEGHEIGSHSYDHPRLNQINKSSIKENLERGKKELEKIVNQKIIGFRAPYLEINPFVYQTLKKLGFVYSSSKVVKNKSKENIEGISEIFLIRPLDYDEFENKSFHKNSSEEKRAESFYKKVVDKIDKKINGVLGMHPWVINANKKRLETLDKIIKYGKDKGTKFVTCKEYLEKIKMK